MRSTIKEAPARQARGVGELPGLYLHEPTGVVVMLCHRPPWTTASGPAPARGFIVAYSRGVPDGAKHRLGAWWQARNESNYVPFRGSVELADDTHRVEDPMASYGVRPAYVTRTEYDALYRMRTCRVGPRPFERGDMVRFLEGTEPFVVHNCCTHASYGMDGFQTTIASWASTRARLATKVRRVDARELTLVPWGPGGRRP